MVNEAQRTRAPIQRLADVVAGWFVPVVVAVAVITFAIWAIYGPEPRMAYALGNAVAGRISGCPCALCRATPMSIVLRWGRGATGGAVMSNAAAVGNVERGGTALGEKRATISR